VIEEQYHDSVGWDLSEIPIELLVLAGEYSSIGQNSGLSVQSNLQGGEEGNLGLHLEMEKSSLLVAGREPAELSVVVVEAEESLLEDHLQTPGGRDVAMLVMSKVAEHLVWEQC
jgi:hypothetical protein